LATDVAPAATTDLVELKHAVNRGNRQEKPTPYPHTIDNNRVFTDDVATSAQRVWILRYSAIEGG
jgi:hypothetical protein